ncbi:MAG: hypothetical protein N4A49_01575 [Marinifilaceae bacterium]|jgi:hypothetical protein|nr:hypothetical protein [Marinifilaceae bacterium]
MSLLEKIKLDVISKFGKQLIFPKNCFELASDISFYTGDCLEDELILEMFGFQEADSPPCLEALDSLARYVDFDSWKDYTRVNSKSNDFENQKEWARISEELVNRSCETYNYVTNIVGEQYEYYSIRYNLLRGFDKFVKSDACFTSFIAPVGYGKSSILAKWFQINWLNDNSNDIPVYINAYQFCAKYGIENGIEDWINKFVNNNYDIFGLATNFDFNNQNIIVILDGLDEILYSQTDIESLYLKLKTFILRCTQYKNIKLILSSEDEYLKHVLCFGPSSNSCLNQYWFQLNSYDTYSKDVWSMPLSPGEIQTVLNNSLNNQANYSVRYSDLEFPIRKLINSPNLLKLFIKVYNNQTDFSDLNYFKLFFKYIENKLIYVRYSEEKLDILNKIIELITKRKETLILRKKDLEFELPIKYKSMGNYSKAYQDLIDASIIKEYSCVNHDGKRTSFLRFYNTDIFEIIYAFIIYNSEASISIDTFKQIIDMDIQKSNKIRIVSYLINISTHFNDYRVFDFIKDIDPYITNNNFFKTQVVVDNYLRNIQMLEQEKILEHANTKWVDDLLFNDISDIHCVNHYNRDLLQEVILKTKSRNTRIKLLSIMMIDAIMKVDFKQAKEFFEILDQEEVDTSCRGFTISLFSCSRILYKHFVENHIDEEDNLKMFYYREMAYEAYRKKNEFQMEFDLLYLALLCLIRDYNKMLELCEDIFCVCFNNEEIKSSVFYSIVNCYNTIAKHELGQEIKEIDYSIFIDSELKVNQSNNYIFQIMYNYTLSSFYQSNSFHKKAEIYYNNAFELVDYSGFKLCNLRLLERMAQFYHDRKDEVKEKLIMQEYVKLSKQFRKTEAVMMN